MKFILIKALANPVVKAVIISVVADATALYAKALVNVVRDKVNNITEEPKTISATKEISNEC